LCNKIKKQKKKESDIIYQDDKMKDLTTNAVIKKLHDVINHKEEHRLIRAYSRAGWISPKVSDDIKMVLQTAEFTRNLPSLDLKSFGSNHVL